jgi:predicted nucleotidyltransferase
MNTLSGAPGHTAIRHALLELPGIAFAIVFGSSARGDALTSSDIDVAIGFGDHEEPGARGLGAIVSLLEEATGRSVDVVMLDGAPPGLAYRVFRDGEAVLVRDRAALVERKARAILEYLDFEPIERACSEAVLRRRAG